jgi:hypothetical protein
MPLSWYLFVICVLTAQVRHDYNINSTNTTFRISVCVLAIIYVEKRKRIMPYKSKLKYIFSALALIF